MLNRIFHRLHKAYAAAARSGTQVSYAQCGEDLIAAFLFALKGIDKPTYLDVGAHHPYRLSNTAFFHDRGARGINVDANPQLCALFRRHRPGDVNLNVGVGPDAGELDFYVMQDDSLSTFSKEEADKLKGFGQRLDRVERIKLRSIQSILDEYHGGVFPDFLSLDIEGKDLDVLRTIDFARSVPKVICVEVMEYAPTGIGARKTDLIDLLIANGYSEYANTNLNAIMVHRSFLT